MRTYYREMLVGNHVYGRGHQIWPSSSLRDPRRDRDDV